MHLSPLLHWHTFQNLYCSTLCNYVICVLLAFSRSCFGGSTGAVHDDRDFHDDGVEAGTDGSTGRAYALARLVSERPCTSGMEVVDGGGACSFFWRKCISEIVFAISPKLLKSWTGGKEVGATTLCRIQQFSVSKFVHTIQRQTQNHNKKLTDSKGTGKKSRLLEEKRKNSAR